MKSKRSSTFGFRLFIIHAIVVAVFFAIIFVPDGNAEKGASWEYVFGVIDMPAYYLLGFPNWVTQGEDGYKYAIWTMAAGGIQWWIVGICIDFVVSKRQ